MTVLKFSDPNTHGHRKNNVKKKRADIDAIHNFLVQAERFCNSTSWTEISDKEK